MGEKRIYYFERPGPVNTRKALELAKERALELGINIVLVPALTGNSAAMAGEVFEGTPISVLAISHVEDLSWSVDHLGSDDPLKSGAWAEIPELRDVTKGWKEQGMKIVPIQISKENREKMSKHNVKIVRSSMIEGVEIGIRQRFGGYTPSDLIKETLRLIGPGIETCAKICMMAADVGAIGLIDEVIALGGTERGLDAAAVIKPSTMMNFFDWSKGLEIREIICKPRSMMLPSGHYAERRRWIPFE
jgi:uncharacterized protein